MVISPIGIALIIAALVGSGEFLHRWRCQRIALLAFPGGTPRTWTAVAPLLRTVAATALGWGLSTLMLVPQDDLVGQLRQAATKRLVIALDVSPSMDLRDAGPDGLDTRANRARDVLRSVLARADLNGTRISIIALYNGARPVVIDTVDPEVIRNVLDDLPLEHAFKAGKTTLYEAISIGVTLAQGEQGMTTNRPQPWPPGQAQFIVVSDGDSVPPTQALRLPSAFASALVIGVGDVSRGLSIDGHLSRQESANLQQLAGRLGGRYHDGNRRHVPTELLANYFPTRGEYRRTGLGDLALAAVMIGSAILAFLPVALALLGAPLSAHPPRSSAHAAT